MPDPIESIAVVTKVPENREFAIKRPGHIAVATKDGMFAGTRYLHFAGGDYPEGLDPADMQAWQSKYQDLDVGVDNFRRDVVDVPTAEQVNEYFKWHSNLLVVGWWVDNVGAMHIMVTNQLEGEELEEFQQFQTLIGEHMAEWRQQKKDAAEAAHAADLKEEAETQELIALGKKCKEHNLFVKLRALENELADVKKDLKKAKSSKGK